MHARAHPRTPRREQQTADDQPESCWSRDLPSLEAPPIKSRRPGSRFCIPPMESEQILPHQPLNACVHSYTTMYFHVYIYVCKYGDYR